MRKTILRALDSIGSADQDRILRGFCDLIRATLRSNAYQRDPRGEYHDYLSIKLDSSRVPDLPQPRPYLEIWVYSPRVEGIHLRGGQVARGGLRWSDRREDFRTEVLGLMRAQNVKNTMIVPVGAKGGFVAKQLPDSGDREAMMAEVVYCYRSFINGMLDITDNLEGDDLVPPRDVVRHDDDDPYLVVAADKGTATFSDIANAISADHGFWLGDAFASGGSNGYDHKKMGITAKGAWESVKRHFRELGLDTQSEDFHGGRYWRHGRRRLWQRHAAVDAYTPPGRLQPHAHLPRPRAGRRGQLQGTQAIVRNAGNHLGRLR